MQFTIYPPARERGKILPTEGLRSQPCQKEMVYEKIFDDAPKSRANSSSRDIS